MSRETKYHRNLWLPDLSHEEGVRRLVLTSHAARKARNRGIVVPKLVTVRARDIVEYSSEGKILVVRQYDRSRTIAMVLAGNVCITVWLNDMEDKHRTIDLSRYREGE